MATVNWDGVIQIWDVVGRRQICRVQRTFKDKPAVAFTAPDTLMTVSRQGQVETWSAEDGQRTSVFDTGLASVDRVELSAHGELAVMFHAAGPDSMFTQQTQSNAPIPPHEIQVCSPCVADVWDLRTGSAIARLGEAIDSYLPIVSISPKLDAIAMRGAMDRDRKNLLVWRSAFPSEVVHLDGATSEVLDIAFSPGGSLIAASGRDQAVHLWSTATGAMQSAFRGHGGAVHSVAFDHAGTRLLSASKDGTARVWPLNDAAVIARLQLKSWFPTAMRFSPDGSYLAVAGGNLRIDSDVKIRDPVINNLLSRVVEKVVCTDQCSLKIWDTRTWELLYELPAGDRPPRLLAFRPGSHVVLALPKPTDKYESARSGGKGGAPCESCSAVAYDLQSRRVAYRLTVPAGVISDAKFSNDGLTLAVATDSGLVSLFSGITGARIADLEPASKNAIKSVALDPTGRWLLAASWDKNVYLWDLASRQMRKVFKGHTGIVGHVVFDSTGRRFLSSSADTTARLWDVGTGEAVQQFSGHTAAVEMAAFAKEDSLVLTASHDNAIGVWPVDAPSGRHFLRGHENTGGYSGITEVRRMEGVRAFSAGSDGSVRTWNLSRLVSEDVLSPPGRVLVPPAISSSEEQIAVQSSGGIEIRRVSAGDELRRIDAISASLFPMPDGDMGKLSGIEGIEPADDRLVRASAAIDQSSQAFDKLGAPGALPADALERFAASGAAGAHVQLAKNHESSGGSTDAWAQAFYHHAIAERLLRVLGRQGDADFEAARRVSLASGMSESDLSTYWRQARRWLPTARQP